MPGRVKIIGILTALPGKGAELRALLDGMIDPSRAEPGNLRWDIWQDQAQADRFVIDELYVDAAAATAHRESAHFKNYARQVGDFADRAPLTLDPVAVG